MSQSHIPTLAVVRDQTMPSRLTITGARIAFVRVNKPEVPANNPTGEPKYSAVLLIPNTAQAEIQAIYGAQWEVCSKELGQHAQNAWQQMQAQDKLAIHDGRTKAGQAGFDGCFFINASAKAERPPKLFHKFFDPQTNQVQVLTTPQNVIYSGCYVNAQINFWQQNNEHGKRVNAELLAVQFAEDGEAFAAGAEADTSVFAGVQMPAAPGFGVPGQQPGAYPGAAPGGMPPGAPQGGFGYAGAPQQGMPPGAPQGGYAQQPGMPPQGQQFAPPQGQQFAPPPEAQYGQPPQGQQFGMPPGAPQQGGYQQPAAPGGYGMPPGAPQQGMPPGAPQQGGYQQPAAPGGYGMAPQGQQFGMPPGAPQGGFPGAPQPGMAPQGYPGI